MLVTLSLVLLAAVTGGVVGLKVVAPRTKTTVDDRVLRLLEQYGVPLAEYLAASQKLQSTDSRNRVQDHRTK